MRKSNKFRLLLLSVALLSTALMAQPGGQRPQQGPPQGPPLPNDEQIAQMVAEISSTLELSSKQADQISDMYTDHFKKVKAQMKKGQKQNEKSRDKMDKIKKELDNQIKAILTPDQKEAFEAYIKEHSPQQERGQNSQHPQRK